jgi:hypothetical protein
MGVRIISDDNGAVIYCSTSMRAFGPVFQDHDEAQKFLEWLPSDARLLTQNELSHKYSDFLMEIDPKQVEE